MLVGTYRILDLEWFANELPRASTQFEADDMERLIYFQEMDPDFLHFIPLIKEPGWRLPTANELRYLLELSGSLDILNINNGISYWTSNELVDYNSAIVIWKDSGGNVRSRITRRNNSYFVRLVRSI